MGLKFDAAQVGEIAMLRQELTKQFVGVFIAAALVSGIGIREIDRQIKPPG